MCEARVSACFGTFRVFLDRFDFFVGFWRRSFGERFSHGDPLKIVLHAVPGLFENDPWMDLRRELFFVHL